MILYSEQNVYEAAKDRIRKLFSMGDRLGVCFSGGKDSTALLHLTLEVTSELGIQKLPVISVYPMLNISLFSPFSI